MDSMDNPHNVWSYIPWRYPQYRGRSMVTYHTYMMPMTLKEDITWTGLKKYNIIYTKQ